MKLQRVASRCGVQSYNSCVICQCFMWGQGPSRCVLDFWGKQSGIECEDIICEKGSSNGPFGKMKCIATIMTQPSVRFF